MIRKRKKFSLRRALIAQARRIFWFYYRPRCMKHYNMAYTAGSSKGYWKCAYCGYEMFMNKDVQIDHINPVMDTKSSEKSWDEYYRRLFVEPKETQPVCKVCHLEKTQHESKTRREQNEN